MSLRHVTPATQLERARRTAVVQVASTMEWLDRPQMQEAMDLVLKDRVHLEFNDTTNVQGYGAMYEVDPQGTPDQACSCDHAKPCVHEQAVELARRVETALQDAAAQDPWATAILEAAKVFHADHPEVDQGRIGRGVDLATSHAVAFRTDGSALVTNGGVKRPVTYVIHLGADEPCNCEDVQKRHITWCKHTIAVELTTQAKQTEDDVPDPDVSGWEQVGEDEPLPIVVGTGEQVLSTGGLRTEQETSSTQSSALSPQSSPAWAINEAPAVAWFKWRVGNAELFYSFREVSDEAMTQRIEEQLPRMEALVAAAETRQAEADQARQALLAKARQADTITPEVIRAIAQEEIADAIAKAQAGKTPQTPPNGPRQQPAAVPVSPPPPVIPTSTVPLCPKGHGAMKPSKFGGWYCTAWADATRTVRCNEKA